MGVGAWLMVGRRGLGGYMRSTRYAGGWMGGCMSVRVYGCIGAWGAWVHGT